MIAFFIRLLRSVKMQYVLFGGAGASAGSKKMLRRRLEKHGQQFKKAGGLFRNGIQTVFY
jgi:hypothetical protein